jgi:NAD(P)-dependent dehydrogenase (short-subunit alcohol dehydrogenase family)
MPQGQFFTGWSFWAPSWRCANGGCNEKDRTMSTRAPASADDFLTGLKGQRVLVTAGAGGIGFAIADTLSRLGARIVVCDVSDEALAAAPGKIDLVAAVKADVSRDDDVDRLFEAVKEKLGGLDALINNAGIAGPTGGVDEIEPADWRRCIDICLTGQFLCARRAVPLIKAAGGGSIVSMSSAAGRHGYAFRTPYSAAKFGVIGFTQSLAKELGPHGIRVNAILPGIIEGPRIEGVISARAKQVGISHEEMTDRYLQNISLRRMTSPYDVAAMVAFLLSDAGINISGQSLGVDGNVETL